MAVILVVLIIINLILYHKMFRVYYFNFGFSLIAEIIGAALASVAEIMLFSMLLNLVGTAVVAVGTVILWILLGALGIGAVYFMGKTIYRLIKNKKGTNSAKMEEGTEGTKAQKKSADDYKRKVRNIFKDKESPSAENPSYEEDTLENVGETYSKSEEKVQIKEEKFIQEEPIILGQEQKGQKKGNMFCVYCGKEIPRNVKFCSYCGKANVYMKDEEE